MYKPFQFEMDDVLSLKNGSIISHQKDMNSLLYTKVSQVNKYQLACL